jgi:hypothetical protein
VGVAAEPTEQDLSAQLALLDELLAQLLKGVLLLLLVEAALGCLPSFRPRPISPIHSRRGKGHERVLGNVRLEYAPATAP